MRRRRRHHSRSIRVLGHSAELQQWSATLLAQSRGRTRPGISMPAVGLKPYCDRNLASGTLASRSKWGTLLRRSSTPPMRRRWQTIFVICSTGSAPFELSRSCAAKTMATQGSRAGARSPTSHNIRGSRYGTTSGSSTSSSRRVSNRSVTDGSGKAGTAASTWINARRTELSKCTQALANDSVIAE
jgi:hypothetical protein